MFLKRFLLLAVIVALVAVLINYMGSREKPYFTGIEEVTLSPVGSEGYSLKGVISCYNPSYFNVKLARLKLKLTQSGQTLADIEQEMDVRIKANKSASHKIEVRFEKMLLDSTNNIVVCTGEIESGGFNAFVFPIHDTIILK